MTEYRSSSRTNYNLGSTPPELVWTIVRGDTAAFRVYVEDDAGTPLTISEWTIDLEIKRPTSPANLGIITDNANLVVELYPVETSADEDGEFTVFLNSANSTLLETGDIFDIELTDGFRVWTVGQGRIVVLEDVTNSGGNS
jgi:hypothetical protein